MQRPTSFTVFGILNLIFAAFGVFGLLSTAAMIYMPQPQGGMKNPAIDFMLQNPNYLAYMKFSFISGAIFCLVLGLSGIGLLMFRSWGRILALVYSFFAIISSIVGVGVTYVMLFGPLMEKASRMPDGPEKFGLIGGAIGVLVGGGAGIIYPLLLFIFMSRSSVVEALKMRDSGRPEEIGSMYRQ
jgi:hypothetical protein